MKNNMKLNIVATRESHVVPMMSLVFAKQLFSLFLYFPDTPWDWHIYIHLPRFNHPNVGK